MRRRLPPALLLFCFVFSSLAIAEEDDVRPSILSVSLTGGLSARSSTLAEPPQPTQLNGLSPWLARLRADYFFLRWLGAELDASGDFFVVKRADDTTLGEGQRLAARLGASARLVTSGGFVFSGSLGYAVSSAPAVRLVRAGDPSQVNIIGLLSHGPAARVSLGYSGGRVEALAGLTALLPLGALKIVTFEPQLWLGVRVADVGPTALWVGLDAALLREVSLTPRYESLTLRAALGVKLTLLPPRPAARPIDVKEAPTTLRVSVRLPTGAPALGATVTLGRAAPAPVDAQGALVQSVAAGPLVASATLAGHRVATATTEVKSAAQTELSLELVELTGPGRLAGRVLAAVGSTPVVGASVTAGDAAPVRSDAEGRYALVAVGPGPVKVRVEAQGFAAADEVVLVPPEGDATLDVALEKLGKGSPATVRGLIRTRTGEPLKASVVIKGLPTKVQVNAEGRFVVTVPGGEYSFVISAPGYLTQTKKVVLADGDQAILHTELGKVSQ